MQTGQAEWTAEWDRTSLKGLTYICTDKGPFSAWLHHIGREDSPLCKCGENQNAAHVLRLRGWSIKMLELEDDEEKCAELTLRLGELRKGSGY